MLKASLFLLVLSIPAFADGFGTRGHDIPESIKIPVQWPTIEDKGLEYEELHCRSLSRGRRTYFKFSEAEGLKVKGRRGDDAEARAVLKNLKRALDEIQ